MSEGRPAYTFIDLGASWRLSKQLQLQAWVYNLLDKRVDYVIYGQVLDGRRYLLGANIYFRWDRQSVDVSLATAHRHTTQEEDARRTCIAVS